MLDRGSKEFAEACVENGLTELSTRAFQEKAKLIAKQKGLTNLDDVESLQQIINDYIAELNEEKDVKRKEELKQTKEKEQSQKKNLEQYAEASGRDKPIKIFRDLQSKEYHISRIRRDAEMSARTVRNTYSALSSSIEPVKSPRE